MYPRWFCIEPPVGYNTIPLPGTESHDDVWNVKMMDKAWMVVLTEKFQIGKTNLCINLVYESLHLRVNHYYFDDARRQWKQPATTSGTPRELCQIKDLEFVFAVVNRILNSGSWKMSLGEGYYEFEAMHSLSSCCHGRFISTQNGTWQNFIGWVILFNY